MAASFALGAAVPLHRLGESAMAARKKTPKDGVFEIRGMNVKETFRDPAYQRHDQRPAKKQDNELLMLFELETTDASLPVRKFMARWDDRDQLIKVYALNANGDHLKEFDCKKIAQREGHEGHHADRLSNTEIMTFECNVKWAGQEIFRAVVELTGHRALQRAVVAVKQVALGGSATIVQRPKGTLAVKPGLRGSATIVIRPK